MSSTQPNLPYLPTLCILTLSPHLAAPGHVVPVAGQQVAVAPRHHHGHPLRGGGVGVRDGAGLAAHTLVITAAAEVCSVQCRLTRCLLSAGTWPPRCRRSGQSPRCGARSSPPSGSRRRARWAATSSAGGTRVSCHVSRVPHLGARHEQGVGGGPDPLHRQLEARHLHPRLEAGARGAGAQQRAVLRVLVAGPRQRRQLARGEAAGEEDLGGGGGSLPAAGDDHGCNKGGGIMVMVMVMVIIITVLSVGCMDHLDAENQGNNNTQHFQSIETPLMLLLRHKHNMQYVVVISSALGQSVQLVRCILNPFLFSFYRI